MFELWSQPLFLGIVTVTMVVLAGLSIVYYFLQNRFPDFRSSFSSILSWLLLAPFLFLLLGMTWPGPLVLITLISIYGAKIFFQMTGTYHRSYFVLTSYAALIMCAVCIYLDYQRLFDLMPPIFFMCICLIPMIRNSYKHMVQYIALTMMNFMLLWAFMHLARIMSLENGTYIAIYIIILTELFESIYLRISRHWKKVKIVSELTPKRSLEGYVVGALITLGVAYALRGILPFPESWWRLACACFIFGSTGDTILVVVRRDLGIKIYGSFVIGRGDFFTRIERLVFVAPVCFYVISYLQGRI